MAKKKTTAEAVTPKAAVRKPRSLSKVTTTTAKGAGVAKSKAKVVAAPILTSPAAPAPREITHDLIAQRAYEIYCARNRAPGNPHDDWVEAERQLRAGL